MNQKEFSFHGLERIIGQRIKRKKNVTPCQEVAAPVHAYNIQFTELGKGSRSKKDAPKELNTYGQETE